MRPDDPKGWRIADRPEALRESTTFRNRTEEIFSLDVMLSIEYPKGGKPSHPSREPSAEAAPLHPSLEQNLAAPPTTFSSTSLPVHCGPTDSAFPPQLGHAWLRLSVCAFW